MSLARVVFGEKMPREMEQLLGRYPLPFRLFFWACRMMERSYAAPSEPRRQSTLSIPTDFPPAPPPLPDRPRIAAVLPAYIRTARREAQLRCALECLANQTMPIDQILVIDDGSPRAFRPPPSVVRHRLDRQRGPARARNRGLDLALRGGADVILLTDSDCLPERTWCQALVEYLKANGRMLAVGGNTGSAGSTYFDRFHELSGTLNGRRFSARESLAYAPTCNLAIRREVARHYTFDGSFPLAACEDVDFCVRLVLDGIQIGYCRDAQLRHDYDYHPFRPLRNVAKLMGNYRRYARGQRRLLSKFPFLASYLAETIPVSALT